MKLSTPSGGGVSTLAVNYNPAADTWISYVRADDYVGSDGDAVTAVTKSAGSSANYTGTATLKTGANGINSRKAFSFNGSSNILSAATGGASLATDFYAAAVIQHSGISGLQNYITFGTASSNQRRSLARGTSGYHDGKLLLVYQGNDLFNDGSATIANATAYLVEMTRQGNWLRLYLNGALVAEDIVTLNSYAGTAIKIGGNLSSAELFAGLIAEVAMASTVSPQQINSYRAYAASRYGITISAYYTTPYVSAGAIVQGAPLATDGGRYWLGPGPIYTGGAVTASFGTLATFSITGNLAAHSNQAEHMLVSTYDYKNVLAIWNRSPAGVSAIRFLRNATGEEMGAIGYSAAAPWGDSTYGGFFVSSTNFNDTTKYGGFRILQEKNLSQYIRVDFEIAGGDIVFYGIDGTTKILTLKGDGTIIYNLSVLPTADPAVAGKLYSNGTPSASTPKALFVSGG